MGPRRWWALCVVVASTLAWARGESVAGQASRLYVGNSRGSNVSVLDLGSLKVVGEVNVGQHVHCVALTPDGHYLFTTAEVDQNLVMSDTRSGKTIATISLPGKPNQCAVTPDGHFVTVPIRDKDSVVIINVDQQKIVKVLPIKEPHNSVNAGSNQYTFVSSMGSHEIDIIDFKKLDYAAHIPVGGRPRPFVVSRDGSTIYVAVSDLHGFNIVDVKSKTVLQTVQMPSQHPGPPRPREFETPDTYTHGLALSPDESELWVTSLLDDCIYIYDLKSKKITGRLDTGDGPNWVVFSPDGKYGCVSSTDSDDVSIFDVKKRTEVARVKVGKVPKRIAIAPVDATSQSASR
jgi:YVTN family beta-propeller protein